MWQEKRQQWRVDFLSFLHAVFIRRQVERRSLKTPTLPHANATKRSVVLPAGAQTLMKPALAVMGLLMAIPISAFAQDARAYRVLATNRTSTMQKEMQQAGEYRLLSTTKTSTMEKELQEAGQAAYEVLGLTVAKTSVGGSELVTIRRRRVKP